MLFKKQFVFQVQMRRKIVEDTGCIFPCRVLMPLHWGYNWLVFTWRDIHQTFISNLPSSCLSVCERHEWFSFDPTRQCLIYTVRPGDLASVALDPRSCCCSSVAGRATARRCVFGKPRGKHLINVVIWFSCHMNHRLRKREVLEFSTSSKIIQALWFVLICVIYIYKKIINFFKINDGLRPCFFRLMCPYEQQRQPVALHSGRGFCLLWGLCLNQIIFIL